MASVLGDVATFMAELNARTQEGLMKAPYVGPSPLAPNKRSSAATRTLSNAMALNLGPDNRAVLLPERVKPRF